ncbi:threonine dehydratase [Stappia sp. 28M-7]|uniref:threonine dehydratase n=1 Tax=Stappia sp. 28M-7 TaxID=2762596 RepID=UPI00163C32D3|nr:threonine dehydratase [Stappia sp. 28M-7]MBC2858111.1 threonine dehydratase [Stappia sp. 28M-7]
MLTLAAIEDAAETVYRSMRPTPQYAWPLLADAVGRKVWVKHENHTPTGAFKVRGGLVITSGIARNSPAGTGIISATRGNHGQSLAFASARNGLACTIVVPHGNSAEKNAAMRAFGAELIEAGSDFDEAKQHAMALADERGLLMVPSFHPDLVRGVATYAMEFFRAADDLDVVYVPIGLGSGICGMISARNLLGRRTRIVGVVSDKADAYALSLESGQRVETASAVTFADGMAVRGPDETALAVIRAGVDDILRVSDEAIAEAVRLLYRTTHSVAEGSGAAALAALLQDQRRGEVAGIVLSGQNIDTAWMAEILAGGTPAA